MARLYVEAHPAPETDARLAVERKKLERKAFVIATKVSGGK